MIGKHIRFRVYIIGLYLLLLPMDAALGDIIGDISLVNYVVICYSLVRLIAMVLFNENINIEALTKCKAPAAYFIYLLLSLVWAMTGELNSWYIFSLCGCFLMFAMSVSDFYSDTERRFLKNAVALSGIVIIAVSLLSFDSYSDDRFFISIGRYMDPNYFSVGFILITAVLIDNIFEKKHWSMNLIAALLLFAVILETGSRGGLLSNIAVAVTLFVLTKRSRLKKSVMLLSILAACIGIFTFLSYSTPEWIMNRFTLHEMMIDEGSGRIQIWRADLDYYVNLPLERLLFGTGFSTHSDISMFTLGQQRFAHSIYMQSLLECGIIGLLLTFAVLITTIVRSLNNHTVYVAAAAVGAMIGGLTLDIHISRFFWNIIFFSTLYGGKSMENSQTFRRLL